MKKFKFRLQSVLEAREKALEDAQLVLAQVQAKLKQQEAVLDELYGCLDKTRHLQDSLVGNSSGISIQDIFNCQNYCEKLKGDIFNQHKLIADIEMEVEESKRLVLEANKAKTMLEKLKEKDYREFLDAIEKHEMNEIDEMATNRYKGIVL